MLELFLSLFTLLGEVWKECFEAWLLMEMLSSEKELGVLSKVALLFLYSNVFLCIGRVEEVENLGRVLWEQGLPELICQVRC